VDATQFLENKDLLAFSQLPQTVLLCSDQLRFQVLKHTLHLVAKLAIRLNANHGLVHAQ
jgi:hypothetical protein